MEFIVIENNVNLLTLLVFPNKMTIISDNRISTV